MATNPYYGWDYGVPLRISNPGTSFTTVSGGGGSGGTYGALGAAGNSGNTITFTTSSGGSVSIDEIAALKKQVAELQARTQQRTTATEQAILEQQRQMRMWVEHTEARRKADDLVKQSHRAIANVPSTRQGNYNIVQFGGQLYADSLGTTKPKPAPRSGLFSGVSKPQGKQWKYRV